MISAHPKSATRNRTRDQLTNASLVPSFHQNLSQVPRLPSQCNDCAAYSPLEQPLMSATNAPRPIWNALIRTHHITSRKKVAKLRQAAANEDVFALLRSGSPPGVMYCEGAMANVENWVAAVQVCQHVSSGRRCPL